MDVFQPPVPKPSQHRTDYLWPPRSQFLVLCSVFRQQHIYKESVTMMAFLQLQAILQAAENFCSMFKMVKLTLTLSAQNNAYPYLF